MKIKYIKPVINIEALVRKDILCVSENAYQDFSALDKDMGNGKSMLEMIGDGTLWEN